jgi:hypothetical protein
MNHHTCFDIEDVQENIDNSEIMNHHTYFDILMRVVRQWL